MDIAGTNPCSSYENVSPIFLLFDHNYAIQKYTLIKVVNFVVNVVGCHQIMVSKGKL
jgi:hypothetical protein